MTAVDLAAIEKIWDAHTAAEFVGQDVDATMATMTDDPVVVHVHVPAAVGMHDGLVAGEHIYWDQATVLAQVGLLDPTGRPVTGMEQVDTLGPDPGAGSFNALLGTDPH